MNYRLDFWILWGFTSQFFFFLRFIIQWYQSEKKGKIEIPHVFWTLSLIGCVMLIVYSLARKDIVFLVTGVTQIFVFGRSFIISKNSLKKKN